MYDKQYSAGDTVDANCTRCRMVTNHIIIAMVGERIARVQCNTCGGQHNYRPLPQPKKETATKAARSDAPKPRRQAAPKAPARWQELSTGSDTSTAIPYAMDAHFRRGQWVSHPSFGLGLIEGTAPPNKIEVLFQDGVKLLRCGSVK